MTGPSPLTIGDVLTLHTIIAAATRGAHVRWLDSTEVLREGVARAITRQGGGFIGPNEDVRDAFLHVSGIGEQWLPVRELMRKVQDGKFAAD